MSTRTRRRSSGSAAIRASSNGYRLWPSRSHRSTHAWWLTPADQYETSSNGTSITSHRPRMVQYTEWHSPTTLSRGATAARYATFIAIGLV